MRHVLFTAAALLAWALPAQATGEIHCAGKDVTVHMNVGRLSVLRVNSIVVGIGEKRWSSQPDLSSGTPITVGQAFRDDEAIRVDITDEIVNEVLGRLRVFTAREGEEIAMGGVLTFKGEGAFVVRCSEGE